MAIRGRSLLSATPSSGAADRLELGFDLGKLFRRPLNLGPLEPVFRREEPVASRVEQNYADRDWGVVERGRGVARRHLRKHEEDGDEGDPDHGDPADHIAPPPEVPRAALKLLAREQAQEDRKAIRDV